MSGSLPTYDVSPLQPGNWIVHVYADGTSSASRIDMTIPIRGHEKGPEPTWTDPGLSCGGWPSWPSWPKKAKQ